MEKRMDSKRQWMATNRLKVRSPFKDLFPPDERVINAVASHMKENGYDVAHPIAIWIHPENGEEIVIDGHLRLKAAKQIELSPVYVARMSFTDPEAALEYAIHNQRDRRNLTDAEIFKCIKVVDKRAELQRGKDGKFTMASSEATAGKSAEKTAELVGTSRAKVEKTRSIVGHGDAEIEEAVLIGQKSIHRAYTETKVKPGLGSPNEYMNALKRYFKAIQRERDLKWKRITPAEVLHNIETCKEMVVLKRRGKRVEILEHKIKQRLQDWEHLELAEPEFKEAFRAFFRQVDRIRINGFVPTSKEAVLHAIKLFKDLAEFPLRGEAELDIDPKEFWLFQIRELEFIGKNIRERCNDQNAELLQEMLRVIRVNINSNYLGKGDQP